MLFLVSDPHVTKDKALVLINDLLASDEINRSFSDKVRPNLKGSFPLVSAAGTRRPPALLFIDLFTFHG